MFNPHGNKWNKDKDMALVLVSLAVTGNECMLSAFNHIVSRKIDQVILSKDGETIMFLARTKNQENISTVEAHIVGPDDLLEIYRHNDGIEIVLKKWVYPVDHPVGETGKLNIYSADYLLGIRTMSIFATSEEEAHQYLEQWATERGIDLDTLADWTISKVGEAKVGNVLPYGGVA